MRKKHNCMALGIGLISILGINSINAQEVKEVKLPSGITRKTTVSPRYNKAGIFLESGTTVEEYNKRGICIKRIYIHDEAYKDALHKTVTIYKLYPSGKWKKVILKETHTGKTNNPSFEEIEDYLENGCIQLHKRPLLHGGKVIGVQILQYTYTNNGEFKCVKSIKLGLDGKLFSQPHKATQSQQNR